MEDAETPACRSMEDLSKQFRRESSQYQGAEN